MTPLQPILRIGWAIHKALFRATGGRVGTHRAGDGFGTLFLSSVGWKSGAVRWNALYYIEDGSNFVVVASNAGEDVDPGWWRNLQATPDAEVGLGGTWIPIRAREATPEEADRLWPRLDAGNPEYIAYRARTSRPIPIVILEPR